MRYDKQILFKNIANVGQKKISDFSVTVLGLGALGSVVAEQLARAGVGKLTLIDHDIVELSNLQRQSLYTEEDINKPKADCAEKRLKKINSEINIVAISENINYETIELIKSDLVIDCTDNLETRFLINDFCLKNNITWIYGAVAGSQGCVFPILPKKVCFKCIFDKASPSATCAEDGIISPIVHIIGSLQVSTALKLIVGDKVEQNLIFYDVWSNNLNSIKVKKNEKCEACNGNYVHLNPKNSESLFEIKLCKTKAAYSAKPKKHLKMNFSKLKKKYLIKADAGVLLVIELEKENIIVHNFGEIVFKSCKDMKKMHRLASEIYEDSI